MKEFIDVKKLYKNEEIVKDYDVVVVGGGVSGICAAMASARHGAKTAIVQARSVFGGNASSECRMHISGASCHWGKKNASETGIIHELMLENKYLNENFNFSLWDAVMWDALRTCDNLDVYLNTTMINADVSDNKVSAIHCYRTTTEEHFLMRAEIFIDCTGNGVLGAEVGAEYRIGCEAKDEFNEPDAPDERNGNTMGNTIYFCARDTGHPVKFIKPSWAYSFDESDFIHRPHGDVVVYHSADDVVILPKGFDYESTTELVEKYDVHSGYWWLEIGGDWDDIIKQSEDIRDELIKCVWGVWDHIKNFGNEHGAENYELVWVGSVPGTREGRRLVGDYMLSQSDIYGNARHEDAVAYGGWPMDEHTAGGFFAKGQIPSRVISFDGLYTIPYRCFYSKNIENLMMAGRNISATKLGMSSARVMGTCAVGGQAAGTAAALATAKKCTPREVGGKYIEELKSQLLCDDCYIPGYVNNDTNDFARNADISVSSEKGKAHGANIINGVSRTEGENLNFWESDGISESGEWIALNLKKEKKVGQVRITFDSNLSEEICMSVSKGFTDKERPSVPCEIVKDYKIELFHKDKLVHAKCFKGNYKRHNIYILPQEMLADTIKITVFSTNGYNSARIFEVRIY